ncbi:TlpA family protein disulfide reductase [Sphingobium lignivorans]|uniref:Thiol-disulfide isomerase/thioredoxin n=1 Tax=Sphingobium lignivorans TaxID=2735886 RepID=A0ABR6NCT0_9SPHN|nr:TlpA disulfide reductase family protein [Sphingobium lignivorans]MBB5985080.1 thiol-disulfide isomerase/thioredoxin [Sphingobium lignivorans]
MSNILHIGPVMVPLDRLVALALMLLFLTACEWRLRRDGRRSAFWPGLLALAAGLIAARGAYVWQHRVSFALDPIAALHVWLGGWSWSAGVVAAGAVLVLSLRRARPAAQGLALLAALTLLWAGFERLAPRDPPLMLPASLAFERLDGDSLTLGDVRGGPVVLNLWATWCPPCRRELPMLVQAAAEPGMPPVLLVDQGEEAGHVRHFLETERLSTAPVLLDPDSRLGEITGGKALPTTLFVDGDGVVRHSHVGQISRVQLDIALRTLRAGSDGAP